MSEWSFTPPTLAGWYWLRCSLIDCDSVPRVVEVQYGLCPVCRHGATGLVVVRLEGDGHWRLVPIEEVCGEWLGPLTVEP